MKAPQGNRLACLIAASNRNGPAEGKLESQTPQPPKPQPWHLKFQAATGSYWAVAVKELKFSYHTGYMANSWVSVFALNSLSCNPDQVAVWNDISGAADFLQKHPA